MMIINEDDFPPLPSQEKKQSLGIECRAASLALASNNEKMRDSLDDLPDELILEILDYFQEMDHFGYRSSPLPKLALTSRRLYQLVIGRLYERYSEHVCETYLFLRTLASNQRIAKLVREVNMVIKPESNKFGWKSIAKYKRRQYRPTAQDKRTIKEGLRAIDAPNWKVLATKCNDNPMQNKVLQETLLKFTPNVSSITCTENIEWTLPPTPPTWVSFISKAAVGMYGGVHSFEHLRSIKVDVHLSILSFFAPLFRLQSLRKIQLRGIAEYLVMDSEGISDADKHARELERLIPPACNDLEELILDRSFYSELCLDVMVTSSRRLKTFKYNADAQWRWRWAHGSRVDKVPTDTSKTITKILRRHEASLETIHIYGDVIVDEQAPNRVHLYDDMTAFTSLKEISCPLGMIMSEEDDVFAARLPSSLVKFRTPMRPSTEDCSRLDALKHILANCETYTQLDEVRVIQSYARPADWKDFVELASDKGVGFVEEKGYLEPSRGPESDDSDDSDDPYDSDVSLE